MASHTREQELCSSYKEQRARVDDLPARQPRASTGSRCTALRETPETTGTEHPQSPSLARRKSADPTLGTP